MLGYLGTRIAKANASKEKSDIEALPIEDRQSTLQQWNVQKQELHHVLRLRAAGVPIPAERVDQRTL
jgi:hypothetical protein